MQELTEELFKDTSVVPYGVVLAAPCDVSADALNNFHESAKKNGAQEHFPWTGRHIEDLLFQPANRDLLFVYFGIQLDPTINDVVDSIVAIQNELIHNLVAAKSWTQFSAIGFNKTHYDSAMGRRSFSDAPLELRIQAAHAYAAMAAIAGPMQQRPNTGNWGRPMATHQVYEMLQIGPLVGAAIAAIEKAITTIDAFMNKPLKQAEAPANQA
ncbi:MAG: hypothetical protein JNK05_13435 [Myxococcales bacterium]|nr:hypothetical protein [Myxococcales bacterium]